MKLYGISNCDTVRRAREWLRTRGVEHHFHDYKRSGVPSERLFAWQEAVGWERLVNRSGTTWRRLPESTRDAVVDAATARGLMCDQPSVIKRPVVEWDDGGISAGFDADVWGQRVGR